MIRLAGSLTALPTPFRAGRPDQLDLAALRRLIDFQVANGTSGLVVCGSTGEGASLSAAERMAVVELCAGVAGGRVPVVAGVGAISTAEALDQACSAWRAGADALLVTTPAYLRPTQGGLYGHFEAIALAVDLPVVLYNIPGRTAVDLLPDTVAELADLPNVVAIKEASGSLARIRELVALGTIDVLCGDDPLIADAMQAGAKGVIGVVSNLRPARVAELVRVAAKPMDERAAVLVEELAPLVRALFLEPNPAPLKAALAHLGWSSAEVRGPLTLVADDMRQELQRILARVP